MAPAHGLAYPVGSPTCDCAVCTARSTRAALVRDGKTLSEGGVSAAGGAFHGPRPAARTAGLGGAWSEAGAGCGAGGEGGGACGEAGAGLSPLVEIPPQGETSNISSDTADCRRAEDGPLLERTAYLRGAGLRARATFRSGVAGAFAGERAFLAAFLVLSTAIFAETFFAAEDLLLGVFFAFFFSGCFTMLVTRSVCVISKKSRHQPVTAES